MGDPKTAEQTLKEMHQIVKDMQGQKAGPWEWIRRVGNLLPLVLVIGSLFIFMRDRDVTRATVTLQVQNLIDQQKMTADAMIAQQRATTEAIAKASTEATTAREKISEQAQVIHQQMWDQMQALFEKKVDKEDYHRDIDKLQTGLIRIENKVDQSLRN